MTTNETTNYFSTIVETFIVSSLSKEKDIDGLTVQSNCDYDKRANEQKSEIEKLKDNVQVLEKEIEEMKKTVHMMQLFLCMNP
jgi:cell division protein FtsB